MTARKAIVVHSYEHARVALAAAAEIGAPITLLSAPLAAASAGAAYFREMIARARADTDCPASTHIDAVAVLDCGAEAGLALGALRAGVKAIRFTGPNAVRAKIADIAGQMNAIVESGDFAALDLLDLTDPEAACRRWLTENAIERRDTD